LIDRPLINQQVRAAGIAAAARPTLLEVATGKFVGAAENGD